MPAGRRPGSVVLANSAARAGGSCLCRAPSQLPQPLQPGAGVCRLERGRLSFPYLIGLGRQLGRDHADFRYSDFPKTGAANDVLLSSHRARDDAALLGEMLLVLKTLAGEEGEKAVRHFVQGNGTKLTHGPDSPLSRMASGSRQFLVNFLQVAMRIYERVRKLAAGGQAPDYSALRVEVPATHWGLLDFPSKAQDPEGTALKAILGGTQGEELYATSLRHDPFGRTYRLGLRWVIFDHFGVDTSDLYAPGLFPFYVLQHERRGYRPYVNEVVIETAVKGRY